jgi:hypothetical protein
MTRAPFAALLVALVTASCGPPLLKLPAAPGTPAGDAGQALAAATATCRDVSSLAAEAAVTGSIGRQRVRARLAVGLAAPASARLEAFAVGQRLFTLAAVGDLATLLLEQDQRVLEHASAEAVMEALTGLPLGTIDLRLTLTGCADVPASAEGRQVGPEWRIVAHGAASYYLQRRGAAAPWQIVAVVHRGSTFEWRAEYGAFMNGLPSEIRLRDATGNRVDLRLQLSQVDRNPRLGPEAFQVTIPRAAERMTIDDLRRAAPFGAATQ